jgi:hypothetical protein
MFSQQLIVESAHSIFWAKLQVTGLAACSCPQIQRWLFVGDYDYSTLAQACQEFPIISLLFF